MIRKIIPFSSVRYAAGVFILLTILGCGIYSTTGSLNPPFGLNFDETTLTFSGDNPEDYFAGYILWYKLAEDDTYEVCVFQDRSDIPTIPGDEVYSVKIYTIQINDLKPIGSNYNFYELHQNEGTYFCYFAVSAYGINKEESEKVEFGQWPFSL